MDDILRDPQIGTTRLPWEAPIRDAGVEGADFVPGGLNHHYDFWDTVILKDHPQREQLLSYLRDGVSVFGFLLPEYQGKSLSQPYRPEAFPGAAYPNRIPATHTDFVRKEVGALVKRGCLVPWEDVKGPSGPKRPRLVLSLSVETDKPRLIVNAIPLNDCCKHIHFTMDTVARVANVADENVFMGSLDDRSGFHNLGLQAESMPLFGIHFDGVDYVWTVLPFGWNESPLCYHSLSEAKAAYLRSRGIPVLAYIDDAWYANFVATFGQSSREQWLSACEALHLGILVSFKCGYFLSDTKCDLNPSQVQRYLGIDCDSTTASFRVPEDKLRKLRVLIAAVLEKGSATPRTLERIAGKCVSMSVAIRPASLWTHYMFTAISKANGRAIRLETHADLRAELEIWLGLSTTSQEGPWYKEKHYEVTITTASSDASSNQHGGVVGLPEGEFSTGGGFPHEWLPRHINAKEMYALLETLEQCCKVHPQALRRAQVLMDVDNSATVAAYNKGRSRNSVTHNMLVRLFELQTEQGFWLSLKWVPSAENVAADAITRPPMHEIIRMRETTFRFLVSIFGEFSVDLMASTENAQRSYDAETERWQRLPFFSRYHCEGTAGVDIFRQNIALTPGSTSRAFGFCFPPPLMVGPVVKYMAECKAHAVVVVPDAHEYWFPRLSQHTVRAVAIPRSGSFVFPHHKDGLRDFVYARHGMRAVELDFE